MPSRTGAAPQNRRGEGLRPPPEQRHEAGTEQHADTRKGQAPVRRLVHGRVEQELVREQLGTTVSLLADLAQCDVARTSTRPVYSRMPELIESKMPLTIDAVVLPGLYVVRTPRPTAMPKGVVDPYSSAPAIGTQLYPTGRAIYASREPSPRPSNISNGTVLHVNNERQNSKRSAYGERPKRRRGL